MQQQKSDEQRAATAGPILAVERAVADTSIGGWSVAAALRDQKAIDAGVGVTSSGSGSFARALLGKSVSVRRLDPTDVIYVAMVLGLAVLTVALYGAILISS